MAVDAKPPKPAINYIRRRRSAEEAINFITLLKEEVR
jgi:hypothetical protein